ncbi:MAG: LysR family transcriptional regulator, partial [Acinetobacter sp.]
MNIDISDIKSFVAVAELKSISGAANKLNYLQSNMTAKIKKIENHYKRQLFIRKPKGVELTESGMNLYAQYKKMIFTWEETENKIYQQEKYLRFGTN